MFYVHISISIIGQSENNYYYNTTTRLTRALYNTVIYDHFHETFYVSLLAASQRHAPWTNNDSLYCVFRV